MGVVRTLAGCIACLGGEVEEAVLYEWLDKIFGREAKHGGKRWEGEWVGCNVSVQTVRWNREMKAKDTHNRCTV